MSRLSNDVLQKFMPTAKKMVRIRFRRRNGRWLEFDHPPGRLKFNFKGDDNIYHITGLPDFEDGTGQTLYTFFEGVPFPITTRQQHPHLLEIGREAGNQQIMQINAEERGFQRAMLLKRKDKPDLMMWVLIAIAVNVVATIAMGLMIMNSLGISFI